MITLQRIGQTVWIDQEHEALWFKLPNGKVSMAWLQEVQYAPFGVWQLPILLQHPESPPYTLHGGWSA